MSISKEAKNTLLLSSMLLAICVLLGAFGAHGLAKILEPKQLANWKTGVNYMTYHSLGLMMIGILQNQCSDKLSLLAPKWAIISGIVLFSGSLYAYALTNIKIFAMITPIGGLLFTLGWVLLAVSVFKS